MKVCSDDLSKWKVNAVSGPNPSDDDYNTERVLPIALVGRHIISAYNEKTPSMCGTQFHLFFPHNKSISPLPIPNPISFMWKPMWKPRSRVSGVRDSGRLLYLLGTQEIVMQDCIKCSLVLISWWPLQDPIFMEHRPVSFQASLCQIWTTCTETRAHRSCTIW